MPGLRVQVEFCGARSGSRKGALNVLSRFCKGAHIYKVPIVVLCRGSAGILKALQGAEGLRSSYRGLHTFV